MAKSRTFHAARNADQVESQVKKMKPWDDYEDMQSHHMFWGVF